MPYCDGTTGTCKDNAASIVHCDKAKGTECLAAACDPKTGARSLQPSPAGKDCEDGNACIDTSCDDKTGTRKNVAKKAGIACNADSDGCTVGDACDGKGACKAGAQATCNATVGSCQQNACQSKGTDGFTCAVVAKADGAAQPVDLKTDSVAGAQRAFAASTQMLAAAPAGEGLQFAAVRAAGGVTLHTFDVFGSPLWSRDVVDGPADVAALRVDATGERSLLVGDDKAGSGGVGTVRVVDRWGFGSCAERGKCATLSAAACLDANDCTTDGCSAVLGCTHALVTENICDPQLACTREGGCTTGSCQPNIDGRTFVVGYTHNPTAHLGLSLGADGIRNCALVAPQYGAPAMTGRSCSAATSRPDR